MRYFAFILACLFSTSVSAGNLEAHVDLSDQTMTVELDGKQVFQWPVSTARTGKFTPVGLFSVQSMKRMHYSSLYNNAPMPFSIFFSGNFAIHGTNQIDRLGTPASAGCVRLHPDNAAILFQLVLDHGRSNTLIHIEK